MVKKKPAAQAKTAENETVKVETKAAEKTTAAEKEAVKEVAKEVPPEKLLLETDAPYLTPVPYRGKENHPAYVKYVAEEIAKLREISFEEIDKITTENAKRIFNI